MNKAKDCTITLLAKDLPLIKNVKTRRDTLQAHNLNTVTKI